jgi:DNA invertase Pin-like site-specific DNA recombinase
MGGKAKRAARYLRVSTDEQTVENQRLVLEAVAERRGWQIVQTYADNGISGAGGRDKRPGFDAMLKDSARRRFDVLMVWAIDRLGRSTATVVTALADLEHSGVAIYADKEGMDATTPHGKAMLQMAAVFAELERGMIRSRVIAGIERARKAGKVLGRPKVTVGLEAAIRARLEAGKGIGKICRELRCGTVPVRRVRDEMKADGSMAAERAA